MSCFGKPKNTNFGIIYLFLPITFCCLTSFYKWYIQTEMDMMKERFSKLLLGEDMSGSGKGVCTALAISNAITNLCGMLFLSNFSVLLNFPMVNISINSSSCFFSPWIVTYCVFVHYLATIFGQLWRLEPLPTEKKSMWRREMEWLLCVSDHIVELIPSWQTFPDGSKLEVVQILVLISALS